MILGGTESEGFIFNKFVMANIYLDLDRQSYRIVYRQKYKN